MYNIVLLVNVDKQFEKCSSVDYAFYFDIQ